MYHTKYVPWAYSSIIPKKKIMPTKFKIKTVMAHAKKQQIAIGGRNVFCTGTKYVPWAYSSIIPKKKMMPTKFKIKTVMAHAKKL